MNTTRRLGLTLVLAAGSVLSTASQYGFAQQAPAAPVAVTQALSPQAIANDIWQSARSGDLSAILNIIEAIPEDRTDLAPVRSDLLLLKQNIEKRENARQAQLTKVSTKLDEALAKPGTPLNLSKSLKEAVELHMLTREDQKASLLKSDRFTDLIKAADRAARQCEDEGQWVFANELFVRLNLLLEDQGIYKDDAERLSDRLGMIALYTPEHFYNLRSERQKLDEKAKPLPPFNAEGKDFANKLRGITPRPLLSAVEQAATEHVERIGMRKILRGGLDRVRTMLTTHDLDRVFPGMADKEASAQILTFIDRQDALLSERRDEPRIDDARALITDLLALNRGTVKVADEAVIHEFGNGAFSALDEFSQIIWPDELARFKRMTEGAFMGVGIQIQLDEETQMIKVVQPLDGTPAQRAGVRAGDFLKKINDTSAVGLSLDQAIEKITGPRGTPVRITVDRDGKDVEFDLRRSAIPIRTAKGWKRTGDTDTDWDYLVDKDLGIGYVRLSGFNDNTTQELHDAIRSMQQSSEGLNGIILDLRFNPGGLLSQAVSVANTFIDDGMVVYTEGAGGRRGDNHYASRDEQVIRGTPVIVLINEGSASASEIVSGAIAYYSSDKQNRINAIVLGNRSFGKGSVQNVIPLTSSPNSPTATWMKLTKQYYHLPDGKVIHRKPNASDWGVAPQLFVEMLPKQINDALILRIDADTPPAGRIVRKVEEGEQPIGAPEPERLLTDGFDLQLGSAVTILKAQAVARKAQATAQRQKDTNKGG